MHSLHGELASGSCEDFVGNCDFLHSSPVVFMTPHITPSQEEDHGKLRDHKSPNKGLLAHHWQEEKDGQTCRETILQTSELVPGHPIL